MFINTLIFSNPWGPLKGAQLSWTSLHRQRRSWSPSCVLNFLLLGMQNEARHGTVFRMATQHKSGLSSLRLRLGGCRCHWVCARCSTNRQSDPDIWILYKMGQRAAFPRLLGHFRKLHREKKDTIKSRYSAASWPL